MLVHMSEILFFFQNIKLKILKNTNFKTTLSISLNFQK